MNSSSNRYHILYSVDFDLEIVDFSGFLHQVDTILLTAVINNKELLG